MIDLRGGLCDGGCGRDGARKAGALVLCEPCYREEREHLRAPVAAAHQRIAEIRVECGVELPQHVEPVAPVRTREVERLTLPPLPKAPEKPARAPKAVQAAPDMPVEVDAHVEAAVARREGRPERVMELDPAPVEGRCRILGCGAWAKCRGLCSGCYWVATHRDGLDHLLLPARCAHERSQAAATVRAQVLAAVEATPGIGPVAMATAGALPISSVKRHLRELTAEGLIVADHRGTYRAAGAAPVAARNATDRLDELVRARGRIRRSEAMAALGFTAKAMQSAVGNLRLRGRLLGPGKGKAAVWLEAAR